MSENQNDNESRRGTRRGKGHGKGAKMTVIQSWVEPVVHLEQIPLQNATPSKRQKIMSPESQPLVNPLLEQSIEFEPTAPTGDEPSTSGMLHSPECSSTDVIAKYGLSDKSLDEVVSKLLSEICDSDDELNDDENIPLTEERDAAIDPACVCDLTEFQAEVLQSEDVANDRVIREIAPDDCYTFVWSEDRRTFLGRRETYTATSGPTFDLNHQTRAIDVFDKIFDADFIGHICRETNRYAEQKIALLRKQNKLAQHSRFNRWSPTHRDEMVSFLAIIILQGLYPLPEEEAYFTFNGFGTMHYFAKIMSYNRFLLLKRFLYFGDNETCEDTTKLCIIRPLIEHLNAKFSSLYMPSQEIVIDESPLKSHRSLSFAQKISAKATKNGIKIYELCDSSSGYLWKFFVSAGQDKTTPTSSSNSTRASAEIVYKLIEPLLHRGHTVIMDSFYNCPLLLRALKIRQTDCYGTLRLNREFTPDSIKNLSKTELRHGQVVTNYCSDLAVLVWRDASVVSMISTYHDLEIGTRVNNNIKQVTNRPSILIDYNKSMAGVNRKDQFLSAQPMELVRNKVWYSKLFRRLYNTAIFNCFVIFSSFHRKISNRQFRTVLAEDLLRRHKQIDLKTESRVLNFISNVTGQVKTIKRQNTRRMPERPIVESNHFPVRTGSKNTCCRLCPKRTRTIWKCEECNVNLCVEECFKAYHKGPSS